MKTPETLKSLVDSSELNPTQKSVMKGFIDRASQDLYDKGKDRLLIEQIGRVNNLSEVIISTDEVKIYKVYGKDEWDMKYPYRSIFFDSKKGGWRRVNTVSPTLDTAFIVYLEYKHLGENSKFSDFALKMLEIKIND